MLEKNPFFGGGMDILLNYSFPEYKIQILNILPWILLKPTKHQFFGGHVTVVFILAF